MTLPVTRYLHNCSPAYTETVATSPYVYFCLTSAAVLGGTAILLATALLVVSKLANSGQRPCLIFLRSKCIAELLVGFYSLLKMHYLLHVNVPERVNAFLADSLLFAAVFLINITLTLQTLDCLCQLQRRARPSILLGKRTAVTATVLLWNAAFVFGFMPQMGWNANDYSCLYSQYYSSTYAALATTLLVGCMLFCVSLQMALLRWARQLEQQLTSRQQARLGLQNLNTTLHSLRLHTGLQGVFTAPYLTYIYLQTVGLPSHQVAASLHLVYATPCNLLRTLISIVLYTLRTPPITTVLLQSLYRLRLQSVHFQNRRGSSIVPSTVVAVSHVRSPSVLTVEGHQLPVFASGPASQTQYSPEVASVPEVYIIDADHQQSALKKHSQLATSATSLHQLHDQLPAANIPLQEIANILAQLQEESPLPQQSMDSQDTHRQSVCSHLAHSEPSQRPSICSRLTCADPSQRPSICSYLSSPGPSQRPSICSLIITPDGSHRGSVTSHIISQPARGRASISSQIYIPAHSQHPASEPTSRHQSPRGSGQDMIQYYFHRPSLSQDFFPDPHLHYNEPLNTEGISQLSPLLKGHRSDSQGPPQSQATPFIQQHPHISSHWPPQHASTSEPMDPEELQPKHRPASQNLPLEKIVYPQAPSPPPKPLEKEAFQSTIISSPAIHCATTLTVVAEINGYHPHHDRYDNNQPTSPARDGSFPQSGHHANRKSSFSMESAGASIQATSTIHSPPPTPLPLASRAKENTPLPPTLRAGESTQLPLAPPATETTPLPLALRARESSPLLFGPQAGESTPSLLDPGAGESTPLLLTGEMPHQVPAVVLEEYLDDDTYRAQSTSNQSSPEIECLLPQK